MQGARTEPGAPKRTALYFFQRETVTCFVV